MNTVLFWFRNDLRLHDQPALQAALAGGARHLLPVAFLLADDEPTHWGWERVGPLRRAWQRSALRDLDRQLTALGCPLLLCDGDPAMVLPALAQAVDATALYCEEIAAPEERQQVAALRAAGLTVHTTWQSSLLDPRHLPWTPDALPASYTPFRQAIERALQIGAPATATAPAPSAGQLAPAPAGKKRRQRSAALKAPAPATALLAPSFMLPAPLQPPAALLPWPPGAAEAIASLPGYRTELLSATDMPTDGSAPAATTSCATAPNTLPEMPGADRTIRSTASEAPGADRAAWSTAPQTPVGDASTAADDALLSDPRSSLPAGPAGLQGGETAALAHLQQYLQRRLPDSYKRTRNQLHGVDFSSKWSPWLANGALSPRRIMAEVRAYEAQHGANEGTYWLWFELLWRDYFRLLHLQYGAALYRARGLSTQPLAAPACTADQRTAQLARWRHGDTGQPLVDAAMRELLHTGYLSNRLRQAVASYLLNELDGDWRAGAAWFESRLIDYDVYSNQGNWLYIAGRGTDPRGGRHFNLDKQTVEHDADGAYRALWARDQPACTLVEKI
ncbi:hypothetical protein ASF61_00375 [Duganella sp. Leaf126]|uniref:FAD-binding domain-containing protein n=1 Tax=Duganella sp. Leaf126 TaxID=1736266 RepID=UPI0006FC28F1|nr:FAD-binding domain-containing protein [Duganella sp. Leaf126]KQQ47152.1 hypothetical protein ASF61_00375 [Duganella sp. Leaf126]